MTKEEFAEQLKAFPFTAVGDLVYRYLFDQIVTIASPPNAQLNEAKISRDLGVSRTPVHSAIERLETDGLARQQKGKAAVITPLDTNEYYQIADLRKAVESHAAYSAAQIITEHDLKKLKAIILDLNKRGQSENPYPVNDTQFHEIIIRASGNPFFMGAYNLYRAKILRYRWFIHFHIPVNQYGFSLREGVHYGIYNALKNRFPDQAASLASEDAMLMRNTVLKF